MKSFIALLAASAALLQPALAHYQFNQLVVNGVANADFVYIRKNTNINSPVSDVNSNDIRCNVGGLASGSTTSIVNVAAGSQVGFNVGYGGTIGHPGPLVVYLAKAPSTAASFDGSGAVWFKIYQIGADFSSGSLKWPTDGKTNITFKIPSSTPNGQYLLRIEHIALHGASTVGGSQHYISCAHINVTNGGSGNPGPKIALPGGYNPNDPSLLINIYWPPVTSYTPPGPSVWSG
ncbi:hypothetical protein FRC02_001458 [Tulasnella sp. 418]|nr:hypothetical protein FRC02_001458 [Tulasnella sp. 418]